MVFEEGKFLTFLLKGEEYGIPINRVKEIIGIMDITSVPRMPEYIKGVINLRGKIIPVMDLRIRFSMDPVLYNNRTCIIVVDYPDGNARKQTGLIVDTVSEVILISGQNVEAPPDMGNGLETDFISGIGKIKEKVVLLLDILSLISGQEAVVINKTEGGTKDVQ